MSTSMRSPDKTFVKQMNMNQVNCGLTDIKLHASIVRIAAAGMVLVTQVQVGFQKAAHLKDCIASYTVSP